jgi:thiamine biosynthesis lipoprotein
VSVAAGSCVDANTASTAAMIMGEAAPQWLEQQRLPARLIRQNGSIVTVGEWPTDPPDICSFDGSRNGAPAAS